MKRQPEKYVASHLSPEKGYGGTRICITQMMIDINASTAINSAAQNRGLQDILQVLMKNLNLNVAIVIGPLHSRENWRDMKMSTKD